MSTFEPATSRRLLQGLAMGALVAVAVLFGSTRSEAAWYRLQAREADEIYAGSCSACHGASGEGGVGPGLQEIATPLADQVVIIRDGAGDMPSFGGRLSEQELEAVAAFSVAFQGEPADTPPVDTGERGAEVYAAYCAECHGMDAEGGTGPNLTRSTLSRDELSAIVGDGRGTMAGFAEVLAPIDLEAVIAFAEDIRVPEVERPALADPALVAHGAQLFIDTCARCHGPDASGGVGPALKASLLTDAELVSVISNGRGAMPGFSALLNAGDIDALVGYVDATRAAAGNEVVIPQDALLGSQVYVVTCATCHGLDGGGGLGPQLASTELSANEIISRVFGGHPEGMPAFEAELDPVQIKEVAQYILTIEGEPPSRYGWVIWAGVVIALVAILIALWYWEVFDRLRERYRKRSSEAAG